MEEQQLVNLELLCQQLYESTDVNTRNEAEKALMGFTESPDSLPQCQIVLERSQSPYALLLAASTLTKLVTCSTSNLSLHDRLQLRNYCLQYLGNRLRLAPFVTQALVQLVARITKHGWFDLDKKFVFRDILDEVGKFLRGSVDHCVIGVQLLHQVVMEMNIAESMKSLAKHRKVATSFRDECLFDLFNLSLSLLRQINVADKSQLTLISWLIKLACACLSFDFIGTSTDESADDLTTVQIPTLWRSSFLRSNTTQLFFDLFHSLPSEQAAMCITFLIQMASVRRSLFTNTERHNFLSQIVKGVRSILETPQLSWLVYIIGSVLGGKASYSEGDDYDVLDGQLVCRVLQLMALTDTHLPQHGSEFLDLAFLYFFEQFRIVYIGDVIQRTSQVYQTLSKQLGLNDESMILNLFITKIVTNLKYWSSNRTITLKTLQLFNDLAVGYSSVRKLVRLESVQFILEHHTTMMTAKQAVNQDEIKRTLISLCRDLRGIVLAFNGKICYMMIFEWIYPRFTTIMLEALGIWFHDPQVTTPLFKLMAELVVNRSQRLQFDVTSPNGVLLFREASKTIACYGERILAINDIPPHQLYNMKLKGISLCFNMLKAALSGNYVNFGVFRLYNDDALDKALKTFVKLLISIPLKSLLDYPKISQAYYGLLEVLTQDHMDFISSLEPEVFIYILSSISEGLSALVPIVCTGCCCTLDHILTYLFKKLTKSKATSTTSSMSPSHSTPFLRIVELRPDILQQMLSSLMNIVMFENCRHQWSMSRPLLGLILLNEEYFQELRERYVQMQPPEKQPAMAVCFGNLMNSIERNLLPRNRDNFTKNLSVFRRDINSSLKDLTLVPTVPSGNNAEMMV